MGHGDRFFRVGDRICRPFAAIRTQATTIGGKIGVWLLLVIAAAVVLAEPGSTASAPSLCARVGGVPKRAALSTHPYRLREVRKNLRSKGVDGSERKRRTSSISENAATESYGKLTIKSSIIPIHLRNNETFTIQFSNGTLPVKVLSIRSDFGGYVEG